MISRTGGIIKLAFVIVCAGGAPDDRKEAGASRHEHKYEELTHFIQILSKEYRSPWEKVFAKLLKEQWISEFEPDKEHQKQLFEVARTLDSLIKKAGKV